MVAAQAASLEEVTWVRYLCATPGCTVPGRTVKSFVSFSIYKSQLPAYEDATTDCPQCGEPMEYKGAFRDF
ncbi:hypothetical protein A3K63_03115 [Candidatus Micrarchaeota archaeon RBG_16_49_10]|nr:MAG: hypothetical protein A3K63_03115 [Candidatus Micrarchaeota archaeon RBG_16_49_10]